MAMTQINSNWHDRTPVKKGDFGEQLVRNYLVGKNYNCYKDVSNMAHAIDFIIFKDKSAFCAGEVKTKPMCYKYPETGFDYKHWLIYKQFTERTGLRVFIFFVDEVSKSIYGNFLDVLDKECEYQGMQYPKVKTKTGGRGLLRYYPKCKMIHLTDIDDESVEKLIKWNTSFDPDNIPI